MWEFLHELVKFFADQGVLPAEVLPSDTDREKTFLQELPDSPDNVCCVRVYDTAVPSLVGKQAGVYYVQVTFRNDRHAVVIESAQKLWEFLLKRPSLIEDISPKRWAIFDAQSGPIPLGRDAKGRFLYSLNFPVKTSMY